MSIPKNPVALLFAAAVALPAGRALAAAPSFDCGKVAAGSMEEAICRDSALSALDARLAEVYRAATAKATNERPPMLKAEQRGWIKGRDECWKSDDRRACLETEYRRRIAELQARYRLVASRGPVTYACENSAANEVIVMFFETDPPTLVAERGDGTSLMFRQTGGAGGIYQGRNESFREEQGKARITWGGDAKELSCTARP